MPTTEQIAMVEQLLKLKGQKTDVRVTATGKVHPRVYRGFVEKESDSSQVIISLKGNGQPVPLRPDEIESIDLEPDKCSPP
ncbi:MAG: hypothetical protein NTY30_03155 [Candidatus Berkelbacteria bacterium]|nr:hypothetical protein [Candidatus Berkelbacteria bacterium]